MKYFGLRMVGLLLFLLFPALLFAQQKNSKPALTSHIDRNFGISFSYPKSWELQIIPEPKICEQVIKLRPPNWQSIVEEREFRWLSDDFPLNIWLCRQDFRSLATSQHYKKNKNEWVSTSHGLEMDTAKIRGKGWSGIEGEVLFRSMSKSGEQGPEIFVYQEVIGIDKNRSLLITSDNTDEPWGIDDLLKSLEGLTIGGRRSAR